MVPRPAPPASRPLIPQFYAGKEVFITGATGFMGKVLVERLLWTCPEIAKLHLLMRQKKDVLPEQRLKELKQSQVFDVIREHCPQQLERLSIVAGDVIKPKLGLSKDAVQQLSQVSVVFHSAAILKFEEPLAEAVEQNLRSVLKVMDLCDQLPLLQVLVYVSTAYSNANLSSVEERVYPAPLSLQHLFVLVDNLPENILAEITPRLIPPKPNVYTFTKAMAESALAERASECKYASAIFRPSIVVSSLRNPFPGWIENLNGACGVVVGTGKGLLHVLNCSADKRADMIPVDIAIDTLIAAAWDTGVDDLREARVYNCCSYDNPTTWGVFKRCMLQGVRKYPYDMPLWYPFGFTTENRWLTKMSQWVLQTAPLHTLDFMFNMFGIKSRPSLSTVSDRLQAMNDALKYFMTREWKFSTENVQRMRDRLTPADAALYNLDVRTIDWEDHCVKFVQGTRRYLLHERAETLPNAHLRMRILYVVHQLMQCLMLFFLYRLGQRSVPAILWTMSKLNPTKKNMIKDSH